MSHAFQLSTTHTPTPDQQKATSFLSAGIRDGRTFQTLLGVTGSGKTFTMAQVAENIQRPTLVISHNKTLAWQLYEEFKALFPENEVHYFVSYYDYYQPEAYLPTTDTYIEKDARINETIDKLRHAATQAALTRSDVLIVASVSCIYNIGDPKEYERISHTITTGDTIKRQEFLRMLVGLQFERNDLSAGKKSDADADPGEYSGKPGTFSAKGDTVTIFLPTGEHSLTIRFFGDEIEHIKHSRDNEVKKYRLFPAKHFVTRQDKLEAAIASIQKELKERLAELKKNGKVLEAARLQQRTNYDIEMLRETGYISGIENYSRHLSFRKPGAPPFTLIDYFHHKHNDNFAVFVDESHMTIPQIRGMYNGDRARKQTLIEHGFRLPSALDNRPLKFNEWEERIPETVFVSATPGEYEYKHSQDKQNNYVVEQLLRPTHIPDPAVEVRKTKGQIDDLTEEIKKRVEKNERVLVTVITKRLAEDLAEHLENENINAAYLHSEIHTLDRPEILADLRRGEVDVLVGVNLLREGLDLPEVSLVAILDADKEGFLRNETTLIQTMGRAARHPEGMAIMYADEMTGSMQNAIEETQRRREYQIAHNKKHNLTPTRIEKKIAPKKKEERPETEWLEEMSTKELEKRLEKAVSDWNFEEAILIRDYLKKEE